MNKHQQLPPVITIDGPSGVGKGTVCHQLAARLQWHFLDSGAIYRILAYAADAQGICPDEPLKLRDLANHLDVAFESANEVHIVYQGNDITDTVRTEQCGNFASKIACFPEVRTALLDRQRAFRQMPGLVTDGRDMGTVVFPDAIVKIFLSASHDVRAKRRQLQLQKKGNNVNLDQILADIMARDQRDQQRTVSPLSPATDAVHIDTSDLSVAQVLQKVLAVVSKKSNYSPHC
jgi:CMP/dCMP kinase